MASKTLFIGLDGMEPDLMRRWSDAGHLPTLSHLMQNHYVRPARAPAGFGDGGLWSSLVTGVNPAKHGHYFPEQFNSHSYMLENYDIDRELRRDPFWHFCSKMGRKVGVIDIYTSPLRHLENGIQVMDWMIHDRMGQPRSWPPSLISTLHEKYMEDPLGGNTEVIHRSDDDYIKLHEDIISRISAKTQASVDLLTGNEWDLFCVGYCDAHDVGHQSWHWHDTTHPKHPTQLVAEHGDPLLQTYQALDVAVRRLLDSAQAEHVFLVAGLGMAQQSLCNSGLQQILAHYAGIEGDRDFTIRQRRDMPYFELPHNMHGGAIRLNLKGRESNGQVAEKDYDDVCDDLEQRLRKLVDIDSGQHLVKEVVRVRQTFEGGFQNNLPDMFVIWNKPLSVKRVRVDDAKVIDLEAVYKFEFRAGDHTDHALFIANKHYQADEVLAEAIAPTICATLGVNLPETDSPALAVDS